VKQVLFLTLLTFSSLWGYGQGAAEPIDTTETVRISRSQQVIRIKGANRKAPLLLFLNGGPGDSVFDQMDNLFGELQQEFVVVLWDTRKVGRTARLKNPDVPLTQALMKEDTYQLVQYLLQKFEREKLVLVAHSYGTTLGFHIAKHYPQLLHAYVATNPMVHQVESEQMTLETLKGWAQTSGDRKALEELNRVSTPFENS